jgi:hypothetical protein
VAFGGGGDRAALAIPELTLDKWHTLEDSQKLEASNAAAAAHRVLDHTVPIDWSRYAIELEKAEISERLLDCERQLDEELRHKEEKLEQLREGLLDDEAEAEAEEWFSREEGLTLLELQQAEASQRLHALQENSDAELARIERLICALRDGSGGGDGARRGERKGELPAAEDAIDEEEERWL